MSSKSFIPQSMKSLMTNIVTGDGRQTNVKALVSMYRDLANNSVPIEGKIKRIRKNKYSLLSKFTTTDCDNLESVKTSRSYFMTTNDNGIEFIESLTDFNDITETKLAYSNDGRFHAKLKTPKPENQFLEIWDRSKLIKTLNIHELDTHGLLNFDSHFSSFCWCPFGEQDKLLYICQPKQPKHLSFFKEKLSVDSSNQQDDLRGQEYIKKEDWGECLNGVSHTILCVLDASNDCKITIFDFEGFSLANSRWFDNGTKIVSLGYEETTRKLGLLHYNGRPTKIIIHDLESLTNKILDLNGKSNSYGSVRVNHAGDKFIYLSCPLYGAHCHSQRMNLYDHKTGKTKQLIDEPTKQVDFFIKGLTDNCFTMDDKNILFVSSDHLNQHMCVYNLDKGLLSKIKFPTSAVSILDFNYDIIMAVGSDINASPTIFVGTLNSNDPTDVIGWHQIEDCIHFAEIDYEQYKITTEDGKSFISAVLIKPNLSIIQNDHPSNSDTAKVISNCNKLPTIVLLHGGPHSAFNIEYFQNIILYAKVGFNLLIVNYRGSTGVSEDYIQSLCGRAGELDVEDCLTAIRHFVKLKMIDPSKLILSGGSHGGFLAAHLSCQDEFKFTSAIIRNPVIDVSTLYATSDIPDWCPNVSLGHNYYDFNWTPTGAERLRMFESSPISKVERANVPTFMMLGNKDRRVNMYQGERWVDLLKAKGIETMCKIYNDAHALAKVDVSADSMITSIVWILEHLPKD